MEIESSIFIKLGIFLILLCFSAFFAGSESALFSLGRLRVRRLKKSGLSKYNAAKKLLEHPTKLIATLLIGNEIVNAAIGIVGTSIFYQLFKHRIPEHLLPFCSVLVVLPVLLIFGEMLPKTFGLKRPVILSSYIALPLQIFSNLIYPLRDLIVWAPEQLLKFFGHKPDHEHTVSEDIFIAMVDTSTEEGVLDTQEQSIIHNVLQLDDVMVNKIMTGQETVSYFHKDMFISDALLKLQVDSYSRFPVIEYDSNQVCGVLYSKDLLSIEDIENTTVEKIMRKPLFIPPTSNALELFTLFKLNKMHFAIVSSDNQDDFLGVVTLEDVLEEIFGDLKDERDLEESEGS